MAVGGGRGGAADRGGHGRGCGRGRDRVSNVDRQRLVDAFEDGDDYHELAALLGIPYQTARSIIRVGLADGHVQRPPEGGARNIKLTDDMQTFINLRFCATTAFHHHRRGWSGTDGSLPRHGNFLNSTIV